MLVENERYLNTIYAVYCQFCHVLLLLLHIFVLLLFGYWIRMLVYSQILLLERLLYFWEQFSYLAVVLSIDFGAFIFSFCPASCHL